eukprot:jgi/Chrzof1/675/Cz01g24210.t1
MAVSQMLSRHTTRPSVWRHHSSAVAALPSLASGNAWTSRPQCSQQRTCIHRRHLLSASTVLAFGQFQPYSSVAQAAIAEFSQIEVQIPTPSYTEPIEDPPTFVKATGRIVAVGDLHGDMEKTVKSLQLARVLSLDRRGRATWVGGDTVLVQLGDVLDRGNAEIAIIRLLRELDQQARKQGGRVYMLNGNHESLNVCGNFRYVTPGGFAECAKECGLAPDVALEDWKQCLQARATLYLPGGSIARELSKNPTVLVVNDTAFVHGGLLPVHVSYGIERINLEVAAWMRRDRLKNEDGWARPPYLAMGNATSIMWDRQLSIEHFQTPIQRYHACRQVSQALTSIGAKRLVVGHTPQMRGVNCECDGKVWRVDVGMSSGVLNAPVGILELYHNDVTGETDCRIVTEESQILQSYDEQDVAIEL